MPAKPKPRRIPKYRLNRTTGRACVELNGHVHWLGTYGSEESRQKYDRLIAEMARQRPPGGGEEPRGGRDDR